MNINLRLYFYPFSDYLNYLFVTKNIFFYVLQFWIMFLKCSWIFLEFLSEKKWQPCTTWCNLWYCALVLKVQFLHWKPFMIINALYYDMCCSGFLNFGKPIEHREVWFFTWSSSQPLGFQFLGKKMLSYCV